MRGEIPSALIVRDMLCEFVRRIITERKLTEKEVKKIVGFATLPEIRKIMDGDWEKINSDVALHFLAFLGWRVEVYIRPRDKEKEDLQFVTAGGLLGPEREEGLK